MSKIESDAIDQLMNNFNNSEDKKSNLKKEINNKDLKCIAAKQYATRGDAYSDIIKKIPVILLDEEHNGNMKKNAYRRCFRTKHCGTLYCKSHLSMVDSNVNFKTFEQIYPLDINDKTKYIATINDEYFERMGERGANKKNLKNTILLPDDTLINIKNIFEIKNVKTRQEVLNKLDLFAEDLLKKYNIKNKNIQDKPEKKIKKDLLRINIDETNNKLSNNIINNSINNIIESDDNNELSDNDDKSENDELNNNKLNDDNSNNSDILDDNSEGVPCISIYTQKGKQLWLNVDDNTVYEPEGEDNGEEIGILKEISEEYHTILHENKMYTVLKELSIKKYNKIYCCVLSDNLFDKNLNLVGKRKKLKNKEYKFEFNNEI